MITIGGSPLDQVAAQVASYASGARSSIGSKTALVAQLAKSNPFVSTTANIATSPSSPAPAPTAAASAPVKAASPAPTKAAATSGLSTGEIVAIAGIAIVGIGGLVFIFRR